MDTHYPQLTLVHLLQEGLSIKQEYANFVVNTVNQHCLRIASFEGVYPWHLHPDSDELFMVLQGELILDFVDRESCVLGPYDCLTVPAGVVHRTRANQRTINLCFELIDARTQFVEVPPRA